MRKGVKAVALLLLFAALLTLTLPLSGCKKRVYEPIESTEEEARVVYTLRIGDKSYEVKYELYRALFLNMKEEFDKGDESVWTGDDKEEYVAAIDAAILERVCEIYSAFALCDELNIDLYSSKVEDTIYSYLVMGVEGGDGVVGYGSYDAYLEALYKMNLNYSTQELLYRYSVAMELIDEYYIGTFDVEDITDKISIGNLSFSSEDVREFYFSDECVRVLRAVLDPSNYYEDQVAGKVKALRDLICEAAPFGEDAVARTMIGNTTMAGPEVERGLVIARHNLDKAYYGEMTDAAFALEVGEVSEAVLINDGDIMAYYIMYRAEKSEENFTECYSEIAYIFLSNVVGGYLDQRATQLLSGAEATDILKQLDRSTVSMGGK